MEGLAALVRAGSDLVALVVTGWGSAARAEMEGLVALVREVAVAAAVVGWGWAAEAEEPADAEGVEKEGSRSTGQTTRPGSGRRTAGDRGGCGGR